MAFQGLNLGIDFTGGNIIQVYFEQEVTPTQVREVLSELNLAKSPVQESEANHFIIRTPELPETESKRLIGMLEQRIGKVVVERNEKIGAVIGKELTRNALVALLIASALMVIYISWRFEFLFGIAAILALVHDMLITISIFSLFRFEVDSAFVAAVLTIIGYSINNTIVVFDRLRENLRAKHKAQLAGVINLSVNQTLSRSVNTMLTTSFALLALIFFGGATTKLFALAMLIGSISGTYSSVFIASPLWMDLKGWWRKRTGLSKSHAH